ncbi:Mth938-like domain-containing protein [Thermodesulfatator autotrophicus]|uniref:Mth938-like domain-containing protein n=1 Tax=Thermodesulfatator autotrophicus TaxID=1795632 RepID=A0A177EAS1_9BACT|nr:Mth938-like domain-containing protein [Thermodesulfatator autotrophicus]OAG28520.1 hypothetical protein TH606_01440 [Thermodesulfatator autotrophicus]
MSAFIESYSFGNIVIKGNSYNSDVKIINGEVKPNWWRKEGHRLYPEDITDILESDCKVLVVGTGAYGVMKIDPTVEAACQEKGLKLEAYKTSEAVKRFNELMASGEKVAGAFHLTC